jgi:hypothetical protein
MLRQSRFIAVAIIAQAFVFVAMSAASAAAASVISGAEPGECECAIRISSAGI